jgi:hypothetical protein
MVMMYAVCTLVYMRAHNLWGFVELGGFFLGAGEALKDFLGQPADMALQALADTLRPA